MWWGPAERFNLGFFFGGWARARRLGLHHGQARQGMEHSFPSPPSAHAPCWQTEFRRKIDLRQL